MPHFPIECDRTHKDLLGVAWNRKKDPTAAIFIDFLDIIAAITFLWGSTCFLPGQSIEAFKYGCELFVAGSALYCLLCIIVFCESVSKKSWCTLDAFESLLYIVGSFCFLVGTYLYWPPEDDLEPFAHAATHGPREALRGGWNVLDSQILINGQWSDMGTLAAATFVNLNSREYCGSVLFVIGSSLFALAAFCSAMKQRKFHDCTAIMLSTCSFLNMVGSIFFIIGSVCFLPTVSLDADMAKVGAWCYIAGSVLFLTGSVVSLWRTVIRADRAFLGKCPSGAGAESEPLFPAPA